MKDIGYPTKNLIPQYIYRQFIAGRRQGVFEAASLFADISGFTLMTEVLMQHSKMGAESLTEALNSIFNPLVKAVYAFGGFIPVFGGDSFTALFPLRKGDSTLRAAQAAFMVKEFFDKQSSVRSLFGNFDLGVKIGLGCGRVEWNILGQGERYAYSFRGEAVDAAWQAEHSSDRGQIIAAPDFRRRLGQSVTAAPADAYYHLIHLPEASFPGALDKKKRPARLEREVLGSFVLDAAIELASGSGEFREVAPVFISFDALAEPNRLNDLTTEVLRLAHEYGGYFNKLDFGDKGALMLILFGAPVTHEKDLARAADFLLALREQDWSVQWRAGLSYGTVYAGVIGGEERCEYTAIGDTVNLASRLMRAANWGEVWLSNTAGRVLSRAYHTELLGEYELKGKSGQYTVYRLGHRKPQSDAAFFTGTLVGRKAELTRLQEWLKPAYEGQFAGLAYISGEAGIGKSRLADELRREVTVKNEDRKAVKWLTCQADEILRQPFNPFLRFLDHYFEQSPDRSTAENLGKFHRLLDGLIASLHQPAGAALVSELERTRSVLAALLDLHWQDSLYEQLEPKLRYENTLSAVKALILAECLRQPVVLHLEDAHLLDHDSQALLQSLVHRLEGIPLAILLTCRPLDGGSIFRMEVDAGVPEKVIDLGDLPLQSIRWVAEQALGGNVSEELADFLAEKAGGNPFFIEQLVMDLRERGSLVQSISGIWNLTEQGIVEVPTNISAVLVARLDRLEVQVHHTVQMAAVLGQEFEKRVLLHMLRGDAQAAANVKKAEEQAIWSALSEGRYLFKHALLRDAAYSMQMRSRLRNLHRLAGEAIQRIHADDLASHYANLTYHFGQAGESARELEYAQLAGGQAAWRFANTEAVRYYTRALELLPETDLAARCDLLLKREDVYELQGAWAAQAQDIIAIQSLAEELGDERRIAEGAGRKAHYLLATGDYQKAVEAMGRTIELARACNASDIEAVGWLNWGQALWQQGDYAGARTKLEQALALAQANHYADTEASSLSSLGNVLADQGENAEAENFYAQALRHFRQHGDRRGESAVLNNLGILSMDQGDYVEALARFEMAVQTKREIGDRRGEGNALANLGIVAFYLGDYLGAGANFTRSLEIFREVGARRPEGLCLVSLGLLYNHMNLDELALKYSQQALAMAQEMEDKPSQGNAYTNLGHALTGLGRYDEAFEAYQHGLELRREAGQRHMTMEPLAGLARVAKARDDLTQAKGYVEEILAYLQSESLEGVDDPFWVYLTCYRVLQASGDERAAGFLQTARELLVNTAARIGDEVLRRSFLENVPAHRDLMRSN